MATTCVLCFCSRGSPDSRNEKCGGLVALPRSKCTEAGSTRKSNLQLPHSSLSMVCCSLLGLLSRMLHEEIFLLAAQLARCLTNIILASSHVLHPTLCPARWSVHDSKQRVVVKLSTKRQQIDLRQPIDLRRQCQQIDLRQHIDLRRHIDEENLPFPS